MLDSSTPRSHRCGRSSRCRCWFPLAGELCEIPGLRVRRIAGFPCGWYYFVRTSHVDVVRLLADAEDLPAILRDSEVE